jgi:DNA-binding MarR family transcriptional regulator
MVFARGPLVPSVISWTVCGHAPVIQEAAVDDDERLIADIMVAQQRLQRLFAYDRSDPLFNSHLTLTQIKILMLLMRHGNVSGGELARLVGVGLAALSGMVDRLVLLDLVARTEDLRDRRVRRIGLTKAGNELIGGIMTAGAEKHRKLLSRLSGEELSMVSRAMDLLVRAASDEMASEDRAHEAHPGCAD